MSNLDNLYADLGLGFVPAERSFFLQELADVVRHAQSELGAPLPRGDRPSPAAARRINALLKGFDQEEAAFSGQLSVLPLRQEHFAAHGLSVPVRFADLSRRFDFYFIRVPITLIPRRGWRFERLECTVAFNIDRPTREQPVVFQAFPQEVWQSIARFTETVEVGIDSNLQFKADLKHLQIAVPNLDAGVSAAVGLKVGAGVGFIMEPQAVELRRTRILCRGLDTSRVFWRLESEQDVDQEHLGVSVVLQVPKQSPRVDVTAALKATHDLRFLPLDIHALFDFLRERTRDFFRQGAPLPDGREWRNVTADL